MVQAAWATGNSSSDYQQAVKLIGASNSAAIKALSAIIEHDPGFRDARITRARLNAEAQRWEEALKDFNALAVMEPGKWEWHGADCLTHLRRPGEALQKYKDAYKFAPGEPRVLRGLSLSCLDLQQFDQSLDWSKRCLKITPNDMFLHLDTGYILARMQNNAEAQLEFRRAKDLALSQLNEKKNPASVVEATQLLARLVEELTSVQAASEAAELAEVLASKYPRAETLGALSFSKFNARRFEESAKAATQSLQLDPNSAKVLMQRAYALLKLNQYEAAVADIRKARMLGYPHEVADPLEVRCFIGVKQFALAYSMLKLMMKSNPSPELNLLAFDCLINLPLPDRDVMAKAHLEAAIAKKSAPRPVVVRQLILNSRTCSPAESEARLNKLIADNPGLWELYSTRANYWLSRKKYNKAIEDLTQAVSKGCTDPEVFIQRSRLYEDTLNGDAALRDANSAVQVAPQLPQVYKQRAHVYKFLVDRPDLAEIDTKRYLELTGRGFGSAGAKQK